MARFVATRDAASVELQDTSNPLRYWAEIPVGGLDAHPNKRGTNTLAPGRQGQTWRPKKEHDFPLTIHLFVGELSGTTYLELMDDIYEVFAYGTEVALTLHPDAGGVGGRVPAGMTATTTVEVIRFTGSPAILDVVRDFEIDCVGITPPLGWTIA